MSSDENCCVTADNEDVIQHIDDAYEANYVENFAPKAQEEILSEFQDNQICDGEQNSINCESNIATENDLSKNLADEEESEKSESVEISHEDINEVSNQLIDKVVIEAESNLIYEDEQNNLVDEIKCVEVEEENFEQSEVQIEAVDSEKEINEGDVDMAEPVTSNEINEETKESTLDTYNSCDEPSKEIDEEICPPKEINEIDLTCIAPDAAVQSVEETLEVTEVEPSVKNEDEVISDEIINNVSISEEKEPEQEIESKIKTTPVATKGKDVKSLSSTYGQEDTMKSGDCCICNKIVYPLEKLATNDRLFHKTCFRCTKCKNALSAGNFTFNQGRPYCTPHYVELFKKRGRYDEVDVNTETEISTTTDTSDLTDELPAPDTTKNILAKFRDLQTGSTNNNVNQTITSESLDEMPAPNTTKNLKERFQSIGQDKQELKCKPKIDIPRHTNGHQNGTSENEPIVLPSDVVRASEPSQDDRPVHGITKNLVNRFREMEGSSNN